MYWQQSSSMDNDLYHRLTALENDVQRLMGSVQLLEHSTLVIKPINLQTILVAHLMQLGFSPQGPQSHIQYICKNAEAIASALGMRPSYVKRFFELYCSGGDEYEHVATSLGISDAISQCDLPSYDLSLWKEIFLRTFNRTIAQEFAEAGRTVWKVDGRWIRSRDIHPRDQRFYLLSMMDNKPEAALTWNPAAYEEVSSFERDFYCVSSASDGHDMDDSDPAVD
ncbi:hypothetical protein PILCRDRAFT_89567 [Piloderma croceum F 1598]|uniref:Uncharacterized protein n=1 Tax=Piloderma croceum (strain F 1598) TaxID=765440 RepID=A0A0C3FLQ3_PILCF|nr:hypothetical protein PILCRDRAFT_89567 [Piloderma croceum F 1598]